MVKLVILLIIILLIFLSNVPSIKNMLSKKPQKTKKARKVREVKEKRDWGNFSMKKYKNIIIISVIVILLLIVLFASIKTVPTGSVGVKTRFGAVQDSVITEGINLKLPFIEKIVFDGVRLPTIKTFSKFVNLKSITLRNIKYSSIKGFLGLVNKENIESLIFENTDFCRTQTSIINDFLPKI